ncbi:MAG TPA: S41 family peptidase [Terriglobales bacterium]|nr:S41 family peptidase [Terriglobales bacterium]
MSEKVYAWLLRLYPCHFREAYGEEALQLFHDRARDERGFLPRLRLWLDLLADLAVSLPRQYRYSRLTLPASTQRLEGIPAFAILRDEPPCPGALLFGALLSVLVLMSVSLLLNHVEEIRPVRGLLGDAAHHESSQVRSESKRTSEDAELKNLSGQQAAPASGSGEGPTAESNARPVATGMTGMNGGFALDAAERRFVIRAASANLRQHYFDHDAAEKTAGTLLMQEKRGDYDRVTDGAIFARLLTTELRDLSHDRHLVVVYNRISTPQHPPTPTAESLARYRKAMQQQNCTFEDVRILSHNIGYLKLNSFPDALICGTTATAAMARLNHADAIIFDLRDNRGGSPNMVKLIASYLFNHPEYLYNPKENTTDQSWTVPVAGSRLVNKPAFVLTSEITLSAAEQFTFNLKMLKRATVVGETTGGAAHAGVYYRIDDHFGMGIPETKSINPFSNTDWEGTGVEPDVRTHAADALRRAEGLSAAQINRTRAAR